MSRRDLRMVAGATGLQLWNITDNCPAGLRRRRLYFAGNVGGVPCASTAISTISPAFDTTRKRRKSFPSETHVKRGRRVVHGDVELSEKLGRNDLCPCGSGQRFQALLHEVRTA